MSSDAYADFADYGNDFSLLINSADRIPQGQAADDESNDDAGGPIRYVANYFL
jgi:hypothetical protein